MDAYARTSTDAGKVEEIFRHMKRIAEENRLPSVMPDIISYTTLMRAWVKEAKPGYAAKVEQLLDEIEANAQKGMRPDIVTYGVVLNALSRCGDRDAGTRGEAILHRMRKQGVEPNRICYNSIMDTYATQGDTAKAKAVLDWMEREASSGNVAAKPSARDYSICVSAYAAEGGDEQHFQDAFRLFRIVAERYKEGDMFFKTGGSIVTSLLVVLAKSNVGGKGAIAKDIWQMAQEIDIVLDLRNYNALIRVCSTETVGPKEKLEALELAVTSFQVMRQGQIDIDKSTFIYLMCCCNNLIDDKDERTAAIEEFLRNCCEAGMVTEDVLSHFHQFVPESHLLSDVFLEEGGIDLDSIPPEWTRAV